MVGGRGRLMRWLSSGDETSWKRGESPAETRCPSEDLGEGCAVAQRLRTRCLLRVLGGGRAGRREAAGKPTGPLILVELGTPSHCDKPPSSSLAMDE